MIYIPFTHKYNDVKGEYIKMVSDTDYPDWLNQMFQKGEPFIIVEHDVHPTPAQLKELTDCPEQWCAYGYDTQDNFSHPTASVYFGCIKFGAELIAKTKNVWQTMENKTWDLVDVHFHPIARQFFTPHQHYPAVVHSKE
jgi:hypothetical protein